MKKNNIISLSMLVALLTALGFSYYYFNKYRPKVLRKIAEVRGITTGTITKLPHPEIVRKLDSSNIKGYDHLTYRTPKSLSEIQQFYENIFDSRDWELESISYENNEIYIVYKSDEKQKEITVQAIKESSEGNTLVSVKEAER